MATFNIEINTDKKCKCGKKGVHENGLCLDCILKAMKKGQFNHIQTGNVFASMEKMCKGDPEDV